MRFRTRHNCAMTLMEVIVGITMGVMVLGFLYSIFMTTQRNSNRAILKEQIRQEALIVERQVSDTLRKAIPKEILTLGGAMPGEVFQEAEMQFFAGGKDAREGIGHYLIKNKTVSDKGRQRIVLDNFFYIDGKPIPGKKEIMPGMMKNLFSTTIKFSYASEYEGLEPKWQPSTMNRPKVVRYIITVVDPEDRMAPIVLSSAVRFP